MQGLLSLDAALLASTCQPEGAVVLCSRRVPEILASHPAVRRIFIFQPASPPDAAGVEAMAWMEGAVWQTQSSIRQRISGLNGCAWIFLVPVERVPREALRTLRKAGVETIHAMRGVDLDRFTIKSLLSGGRKGLSDAMAADEARLLEAARHLLELGPGGGFRREQGFAYAYDLPEYKEGADALGHPTRSRLVLFEDDVPLGPAHAAHDLVRAVGLGMFSHWEHRVLFSTSDNTDPNINGRLYRALVLDRGAAQDRLASRSRLGSGFEGTVATSAEALAREQTGARPWYKDRTWRERVARIAKTVAGRAQRDATPLAVGDRVTLMVGYLGPGGAERQICNLARELKARGYRPEMLTVMPLDETGSHFAKTLLADTGIPIQSLAELDPEQVDILAGTDRIDPSTAQLLLDLPLELRAATAQATAYLLDRPPSAMICYLDLINLIGGLAAAVAGVPRILLSGRNLAPTNFPYLYRDWLQPIYSGLIQGPQLRLTANSAAGARSYAAWLGLAEAQVAVIPNGIAADDFPAPSHADRLKLRLEMGLDSETPFILGIFRLSPEKRPLDFLEVVGRLRENHPGLTAAIAGVGAMTEAVRSAIAERGLADCVRLLGRRSDTAALISAADLVLHTSEAEGLPNVLMETQWLGGALVATDAGGTLTAIAPRLRDFIHPVGDLDGLTESCERLLADRRLRATLGGIGAAEMRARFSVTALADRTLSILNGEATTDVETAPVALPVRKAEAKPSPVAPGLVSVYFIIVGLWLGLRGRIPLPDLRRLLGSRMRPRFRQTLTDFRAESGHCFQAPLARQDLLSDKDGASELTLLEDGVPLPQAGAPHDAIRREGHGAYSHWGAEIWFSASDNSDPRENGRRYEVVERYRAKRAKPGTEPAADPAPPPSAAEAA